MEEVSGEELKAKSFYTRIAGIYAEEEFDVH